MKKKLIKKKFKIKNFYEKSEIKSRDNTIVNFLIIFFILMQFVYSSEYVQEDTAVIFGYHDIVLDSVPITNPTLEIHESEFRSQVDYATNVLDCKWITLSNMTENYILKGIKIPKNSCIMTFDDGKSNQYIYAYPILQEFKAVATFYVITDRVDKTNYMSWIELKDLYNNGNEIGSKGKSNLHLTTGGLSTNQITDEIIGSKETIENHEISVKTFAYPFGESNQNIKNILNANGYIAARDIQKKNNNSRLAPITTSAKNNDFLWNMNYYKPSLKTNNQIKEDIFYNYWWQFEEQYKTDLDTNNNIYTISTLKPTDTSYSVLNLEDTTDKISSAFMLNEDSEYKIILFGYTGYKTPNEPYTRLNRTKISVDNIELITIAGNTSTCVTVSDWSYCEYFVYANLSSGKHLLSVESVKTRIRIDKFSIIDLNYKDEPIPESNNSQNKTHLIPIQEDTVPIFGYHTIVRDNEEIILPKLEIHESKFREQVDYATNTLNCSWITFGSLMNDYVTKNKKIPKNSCVMTFDDGRLDNYEIAYPILERYNVNATFYIPTQYIIENDGKFMTFAQLTELEENGHEIAAHTQNHVDLTSYLPLSELVSEINGSKNDLENRGFEILTFAYPFGTWNNLTIDLLQESGYIAARETEKSNTWRRNPSVTSSINDQDSFIWTMAYYKPELRTNEQIKEDIFYNYWWQFEEQYRIDEGPGSNFYIRSSIDPTNTSYAILNLDNTADKISSSFMVYEDGKYRIEILGTTGYNNLNDPYHRLNRTKIYVDGIELVKKSKNASECITLSDWHYCPYYVETNIDKGKHEISVESANGRIRVDKFRIYLIN